jgi:hypothetical protein
MTITKNFSTQTLLVNANPHQSTYPDWPFLNIPLFSCCPFYCYDIFLLSVPYSNELIVTYKLLTMFTQFTFPLPMFC